MTDDLLPISGASHPDSNAPSQTATPSQAMLATALLHAVPFIVAGLFFSGTIGCLSAHRLQLLFSQATGHIMATLSFAVSIGVVMWCLFTLLSYWMDWLTCALHFRIRAAAFLLLMPTVILGPFYFFTLLGFAAFKARSRQLLLLSLFGMVFGYFLLYGTLNILAGDYIPCWLNALAVPGCSVGCCACGIAAIYYASARCAFDKRFVLGAVSVHVVWLIMNITFWAMAASAEKTYTSDISSLENQFGKPLSNTALLKEYYHDGQSATTLENPLAKEIKEGRRELNDGRLPDTLDNNMLELLDQTAYSPEVLQKLMEWSAKNESFFKSMDEATQGPLFKADVASNGGKYEMLSEIVTNLMGWQNAYHARLLVLATIQTDKSISSAMDIIKHMTWICRTAYDDPFLLANGHTQLLENRRLNAIQTLLSSSKLDYGELAFLREMLAKDTPEVWEERTRKALWAALAWYADNVQNLHDDAVFHSTVDSPFLELLYGYVSPMHFWFLRKDGKWAFNYCIQQLKESKLLRFHDLEADLTFSENVPAAASAVGLLIPTQRQFIPLLIKNQLLQTAIGIEQYHLKHGQFPETLESLVPEILPSLPLDGFSGKPFRYHQQVYPFTQDVPVTRPQDANASSPSTTPKENAPEQSSVSSQQQTATPTDANMVTTVKTFRFEFPGYCVYSVGWDREDNGGEKLVKNNDGKLRQDISVNIWNWAQMKVTPQESDTP